MREHGDGLNIAQCRFQILRKNRGPMLERKVILEKFTSAGKNMVTKRLSALPARRFRRMPDCVPKHPGYPTDSHALDFNLLRKFVDIPYVRKKVAQAFHAGGSLTIR